MPALRLKNCKEMHYSEDAKGDSFPNESVTIEFPLAGTEPLVSFAGIVLRLKFVISSVEVRCRKTHFISRQMVT